MTTLDIPIKRITSPAALVAMLPTLVGFTPEESLVIVFLEDDHVIVTMRMDLGETSYSVNEYVVTTAMRVGANAALIATYTGDRTEAQACTSLVTGITAALEDAAGRISEQCGMRQLTRLVERRANSLFSRVLIDAPALEVDFPDLQRWPSSAQPVWVARRTESARPVRIANLSEAERRWSGVAIELSLRSTNGGILLLDEPERALHRSAEAIMADALPRIADEHSMAIVCATHSPEVLNALNVVTVLVRRHDQPRKSESPQVQQLDAISKQELGELGLLPSDLLRRQKGFLLVEGEHDMAVLDAMVGDELRRLRVEMVPLRGVKNLKSALESEVLCDFSEAHMFLMVDALAGDEVTTIWEESRRLAKTQGAAVGAEYLRGQMSKFKVDEAGQVQSFLSRALITNQSDRYTPVTLSAPDIVDYVDVEQLVPGGVSWNHLRDRCSRAIGQVPSGSKFKAWLRSECRADLSTSAVYAAAMNTTPIPNEILRRIAEVRDRIRS